MLAVCGASANTTALRRNSMRQSQCKREPLRSCIGHRRRPEAGAAPRIRRRRRLAARVQQEGAFEDVAPRIERDRKKRILMLISDTGGGHRASAQALESMLEQVARVPPT